MAQDNSIPLQAFQGQSPVDNFLSSYSASQQQAQGNEMYKRKLGALDQADEERKRQLVADALIAVPDGDQAGFEQVKQNLVNQRVIDQQTAAMYDISKLPQLKMMSQKWREMKQFEMEQQAAGQRGRLTEAQIAATNRSNRGEGGGGLANTVAQREQLAARYGLDPRTPAGQKFILTGTLPDDPAGKPLNDEQAKALGFAKRVGDANKVLEDPMYSKALLALNNNAGAMVPFAGNALVSSDYQMADQAVRDFINAQLRRESGAVISPSEFDNARSQYIPVYGDRPAVLERKRVARQRALENLFVSSGPRGAQQAQEVAPGAAPPPPAPGAGNIPPPPPGFVVK